MDLLTLNGSQQGVESCYFSDGGLSNLDCLFKRHQHAAYYCEVYYILHQYDEFCDTLRLLEICCLGLIPAKQIFLSFENNYFDLDLNLKLKNNLQSKVL